MLLFKKLICRKLNIYFSIYLLLATVISAVVTHELCILKLQDVTDF